MEPNSQYQFKIPESLRKKDTNEQPAKPNFSFAPNAAAPKRDVPTFGNLSGAPIFGRATPPGGVGGSTAGPPPSFSFNPNNEPSASSGNPTSSWPSTNASGTVRFPNRTTTFKKPLLGALRGSSPTLTADGGPAKQPERMQKAPSWLERGVHGSQRQQKQHQQPPRTGTAMPGGNMDRYKLVRNVEHGQKIPSLFTPLFSSDSGGSSSSSSAANAGGTTTSRAETNQRSGGQHHGVKRTEYLRDHLPPRDQRASTRKLTRPSPMNAPGGPSSRRAAALKKATKIVRNRDSRISDEKSDVRRADDGSELGADDWLAATDNQPPEASNEPPLVPQRNSRSLRNIKGLYTSPDPTKATSGGHHHSAGGDVSDIVKQLVALQNRHCPTDYDKFLLFDERDKILCRLRERGSCAVNAIGRCEEMCTEKERHMRIVQKRASPYECDQHGNVDPYMMIKEYARSAADQEKPLPHELRSETMLQYTLTYLLKNVLDECPAVADQRTSWYDFLWSRTRAVRKEVTQLSLTGMSALALVERCTRLHILCGYILCTLEVEQFDPKMNTENLGKCLQTLRHMYEDCERRGIKCENEAEFRSYDVMLHLDDPNVLSQVLSYRSEVREAPPVRFALQLSASLQNNNYHRFFRLLKNDATYLQCCVCHKLFDEVRRRAVTVMATAYGRNASYPLQLLRTTLAWDTDDDAAAGLNIYGIRQNDSETDQVLLNRDFLSQDSQPMQQHWWIDGKIQRSFSEVVYGGTYTFVPFTGPISNSFDESGRYVNDEVVRRVLRAIDAGSNDDVVAQPPPPPLQKASAAFAGAASVAALRDNSHLNLTQSQNLGQNRGVQNVSAMNFSFKQPTAPPKSAAEQREEQRKKDAQLAATRIGDKLMDSWLDEKLMSLTQELMMRKRMIDAQEKARKEKERLEKARVEQQRRVDEHQQRVVERLLARALEHATAQMIGDVAVQELRRVRNEKLERMAQHITNLLADDVVNGTVDDMILDLIDEEMDAKRKREQQIALKMETLRDKMHLLWLRQFWDRWREYAVTKRDWRETRKAGFETCIALWDTEETARSALTAYLGYGRPKKAAVPKRDPRVIRIARRRRERLARRVAAAWRDFVRRRKAARRLGQQTVSDEQFYAGYMNGRQSLGHRKMAFRFDSPKPVCRKRPAADDLLVESENVDELNFKICRFAEEKGRGSNGSCLGESTLKHSSSETDLPFARVELDRMGWTCESSINSKFRRTKNVEDLTAASAVDEETSDLVEEMKRRKAAQAKLVEDVGQCNDKMAKLQAQLQRMTDEYQTRRIYY